MTSESLSVGLHKHFLKVGQYFLINSMHAFAVLLRQDIQSGARGRAQQFRALAAFLEDPALILSTHMAACTVTPVPRDLIPSSGLLYQVCMWCADMFVDKTPTNK